MHLSIWQSPPWVGLQGSKCCHIRWATNFSLCARLKHNGVVSLGSDCLFSNFHWVLLSCTSYRAGYWHTAYLTSHVRRWKMPCPTCPSTSTTDVFAHLHDQCVADSTPLKYLQGFRSKARREHPRAALICQVFHKVTLPWRSKSYAIVVFTWHLTWNSKNLRQTQSTKCCFVPSSIYITSMRFLSSEAKGFQTIGWYVFFVILRVQFPSLICFANTLQFGTVGKGANKNKEKTVVSLPHERTESRVETLKSNTKLLGWCPSWKKWSGSMLCQYSFGFPTRSDGINSHTQPTTMFGGRVAKLQIKVVRYVPRAREKTFAKCNRVPLE